MARLLQACSRARGHPPRHVFLYTGMARCRCAAPLPPWSWLRARGAVHQQLRASQLGNGRAKGVEVVGSWIPARVCSAVQRWRWQLYIGTYPHSCDCAQANAYASPLKQH